MENTGNKHLVFVYNANSGLGDALLDGVHKILSPASYSCSLCAITHGAFTENKLWKEFRKRSGIGMEFLHKDEFANKYADKVKSEVRFPILFKVDHGRFQTILNKESINALKDQESLIKAIQERYVGTSGRRSDQVPPLKI